VAQLSKRSLIAALTAAEIDQDSFQPDVSQNIQLTYLLDSFQHSLEGHYGVGFSEPPDVLEVAVLELEVRNEFGVIVVQANNAVVAGLEPIVRVWSNTTGETLTGPTTVVPGLSNGPSSQSIIRSGTILAAAIPLGALFMRSIPLEEMFVSGRPRGGPSNFLMIAAVNANVQGSLGMRWRELSRT